MLIVLIISNNDVVCHSYSDIPTSNEKFPHNDFPILTVLLAGSEDEARHSEVRSDLSRPACGSGQLQAEGEGEALIFISEISPGTSNHQ